MKSAARWYAIILVVSAVLARLLTAYAPQPRLLAGISPIGWFTVLDFGLAGLLAVAASVRVSPYRRRGGPWFAAAMLILALLRLLPLQLPLGLYRGITLASLVCLLVALARFIRPAPEPQEASA